MVASVCLFVCLFVCVYSVHRKGQNGWAFKMVVVSTGCAIAVDHAFNIIIMHEEETIKVVYALSAGST